MAWRTGAPRSGDSSALPSDGESSTATDTSPRTATQIAAAVRAGRLTPEQAVTRALSRIQARDGNLGAFVSVREADALERARALSTHPRLRDLPLAGVPVAIKDNVGVAGEVLTIGSAATSPVAQGSDHPAVARLVAAGAVVVGTTAVPELCVWGATDRPGSVTRNPWNTARTAGGSSGGSASAVASGQVPIALGNDGLGSIRIPSADCGLVGIKPGPGVVPGLLEAADSPTTDPHGWYGMSENGPIATTVADAALMLSVLAGDASYATVHDPAALTILSAHNFPTALGRPDPYFDASQTECESLFGNAGHRIARMPLAYPTNPLPLLYRWVGGVAGDVDSLTADGGAPDLLQRRTKVHARLGKLVIDRNLVRDSQIDDIRSRIERCMDLASAQVIMTPTLARPPIRARQWSRRGWLANVIANVSYAPYPGLFNLLRWPAISIPTGVHPVSGTPVAVQLAARPGSELLLLGLAAQIERQRPWQRVASGY